MGVRANFAILAAAVLVVESVVEVGSIVFDRPWEGAYPIGSHSDTTSAVLATLWMTAAALLLLKERRPKLAAPAWMVAIAANIGLLLHSVMPRLYGASGSLLTLFVALVLAVLLSQSFERYRIAGGPVRGPVP